MMFQVLAISFLTYHQGELVSLNIGRENTSQELKKYSLIQVLIDRK